jgi:hypothetical protein
VLKFFCVTIVDKLLLQKYCNRRKKTMAADC